MKAAMAQISKNTLDEDLPVMPAKAAHLLLYVITGLLALSVIWAAFAELDEVTRGQGRVIPSKHLQVVQNLEGGIVEAILVRQGERVEAGDVLVRLDNTQFNAVFLQGQESYTVLRARISRLEAEANGTKLVFDEELTTLAPALVASEVAIFNARNAEFLATVQVEESKLAQRRRSLSEAKVSMETALETDRLATSEVDMLAPLVARGIEPRLELLRAEQRRAEAQGNFKVAELAASRAAAGVEEVEHILSSLKERQRAEAFEALAVAKAELSAMVQELPALQDRVARTDVRAPISGTVNRLHVATVGGVIRPGEPIVEIVPKDGSLLVEAFINPSDIAFLRAGQDAQVKLTAYDYSRYGFLDGKVETISADAIENEDGESLYRIEVRTIGSALNSGEGELEIIPGMVAEVDILNGKRTVLDYILKPISNVKSRALRES